LIICWIRRWLIRAVLFSPILLFSIQQNKLAVLHNLNDDVSENKSTLGWRGQKPLVISIITLIKYHRSMKYVFQHVSLFWNNNKKSREKLVHGELWTAAAAGRSANVVKSLKMRLMNWTKWTRIHALIYCTNPSAPFSPHPTSNGSDVSFQ
jgi:hypothetical protein